MKLRYCGGGAHNNTTSERYGHLTCYDVVMSIWTETVRKLDDFPYAKAKCERTTCFCLQSSQSIRFTINVKRQKVTSFRHLRTLDVGCGTLPTSYLWFEMEDANMGNPLFTLETFLHVLRNVECGCACDVNVFVRRRTGIRKAPVSVISSLNAANIAYHWVLTSALSSSS